MEYTDPKNPDVKKAVVDVNLHLKEKKLTPAERALLSADKHGTPATVDDKAHRNASGANNHEVRLDDEVAPEDRAQQKNAKRYRDNVGTNTSIEGAKIL